MMPTRPSAAPLASDRLLIVGIAALLCGLSLFAAGLGSTEGTLGMAGPVSLDAQSTQGDRGPPRPFASLCPCEDAASRAAGDSAGTTIQAMAHDFDLVPAPRRPRERFAGDGLEGGIPTTRGDMGNYLVRTAAAPWYRAQQSPDDTRGDETPRWMWAPIR